MMLWFKHDADARNSLKLRKVRRKYGADGYAIYWFCLEAIAYDVNKDNLTFDLKEDAETIGFELTIQEKRVEEIMRYMVEIGLFENSNQTITCLKLAERLDKSMTNSPKMRAWLDNKGGKKLSESVMTSDDSVKTCAELEENRIDNKRKEKNILDLSDKNKPKSKNFVKPTVEEVKQYCDERKNNIDAESFIDHYEANGWMRGKTKVKDWRACVRTWERNNKNKPAQQSGFDIDFMDAELYEDKYS